MSREREEHLSTADIAAAADMNRTQQPARAAATPDDGQLAPLFEPGLAEDMRARWTEIQAGFVDNPREAVERADELVAQALQDMARSFARHREQIEADAHAGEGEASTENLRVALRRYRSFFDRLLKL